MIRFILVQNRQGKVRLAKYYVHYDDAEREQLPCEVYRIIAPRDQRSQSNFVEVRTWLLLTQFRNDNKIVYKRYAGLYFCACIDMQDNELACLEAIHLFVEILNAYFTNVCEQDLVFHFYKVYAALDEVFQAGEMADTSMEDVLHRLEQRTYIQELT